MDVLKLLEKFDFVASYEILQFKEMNFGYYYKIKIVLSDHTELFATEYVDINERNYSFHWQERGGLLKSRWDNAYHHKQIITFPHHKHIGKKIFESNEISLQEVLEYIAPLLKQN